MSQNTPSPMLDLAARNLLVLFRNSEPKTKMLFIHLEVRNVVDWQSFANKLPIRVREKVKSWGLIQGWEDSFAYLLRRAARQIIYFLEPWSSDSERSFWECFDNKDVFIFPGYHRSPSILKLVSEALHGRSKDYWRSDQIFARVRSDKTGDEFMAQGTSKRLSMLSPYRGRL